MRPFLFLFSAFGYFHEVVVMLFHCFVAEVDHRLYGLIAKAHDIVLAQIGIDIDVGTAPHLIIFRYVGAVFQPRHHTAGALDETQRRLVIVVLILLKVNGNDDIGTHFPCHIDRKIIHCATVDEDILTYPHRLEDPGMAILALMQLSRHTLSGLRTTSRKSPWATSTATQRKGMRITPASRRATGLMRTIESRSAMTLRTLENAGQSVGHNSVTAMYLEPKDVAHAETVAAEELAAHGPRRGR